MGLFRLRRDPVWVFLVAIGVRAAFALETRHDPLFSLLAVDARAYFELAQRFAAGDLLYGREPLWFPPLYPSLLGALFRVAGPSPEIVRGLQWLLGAGSASLATLLGGRFSRTAGRVAGLLLAVSPVAVFYEGQLLYTSLAVFFTALFLLLFLPSLEEEAGRPGRAGIVLGILGLLRSNALLFLPAGVVLLARRWGGRSAVLFGSVCLLALVPVLLRNGFVAGEWTPLTVNGGMIFATGFAEDSRGGRALLRSPRDFGPGGAFHREAERLAGREMSLAEASRFHRERTLRRILADPARATRLTLRKLSLLANVREIDDNLGFPLVRDRSRILGWLPGPWAWILLPAVGGAVAGLRRRGRHRRECGILILYATVYSASLLMFFVNARYRLPLIVPGAVLAGLAGDEVVRAVRRRAFRVLALPVAGVLGASFAVLRDPGVRADPALSLLAVGAALEREGRHTESLAVTDRAIALDPGVAGAHQNRALSLLALGRPGEALGAAIRATALDPDLGAAWMTRGAILAGAGRLEEALPAFRRAADLAPEDADALENLARALAATGQREEAIEVGRRARELGARQLEGLLAEWERASSTDP